MIKRGLEKNTKKAAKMFPVVSITGPRQSGKTTLAKKCFPKYKYYNLEDPNTRKIISEDPKSFINVQSPYIIFDEIQRVPELLSYIQVVVDNAKTNGMYIISGSQNLSLSQNVSQSLAGRVAVITLLPLSLNELKHADLLEKDAFYQIQKGFYPKIYKDNISSNLFYSSYLATYVERDVRQLKNVGNISEFQRFMRILAGRVGQLFNASSISSELGIDSKTVASWLSVLEASYITFSLNPYFKNFNKRIVKSSKIYFYDVGLLAYLLGINTKDEMLVHFARGSMFENLVVADVKKTIFNNMLNVGTYFFRDKSKNEIDLLLDKGSTINIAEIKASQTFKPEFTKSFSYWDTINTDISGKKYVVYSGEVEKEIKDYKIVNYKNTEGILY